MDLQARRPFRDRTDAGRMLARKLMVYAHQPNLLVLALPRGGVPVAYEVATALDAPLDIFLVQSWASRNTKSWQSGLLPRAAFVHSMTRLSARSRCHGR